jgi:ribonuclease HI
MFHPDRSLRTHVFTDGSVDINDAKYAKNGGCGVFFPDDKHANADKSEHISEQPTNNKCELMAIKLAILEWFDNDYFENKRELIIHTDSLLCVNTFTNWAHKWAANNWCKSDGKEIKNKDLIQEIYYMIYGNDLNKTVQFEHVRAHQKRPPLNSPQYFEWFGNNTADNLAKHAITMQNFK